MRLSTIILFIHSPEKPKAFYINMLKLMVIEESLGWMLLNAGSCNNGLHKMGAGIKKLNRMPYSFTATNLSAVSANKLRKRTS